jgi:hypothetical protein
MGGRLLTARARIALALGDAAAAAELASEAIATARSNHRLKYEVASRQTLGSALAALGRADHGVAELAVAVEAAERLGHPPSLWRAAFALARTLVTIGDGDGAQAAATMAAGAIQRFAATLADEHRARFFATPSIAEVLVSSPQAL